MVVLNQQINSCNNVIKVKLNNFFKFLTVVYQVLKFKKPASAQNLWFSIMFFQCYLLLLISPFRMPVSVECIKKKKNFIESESDAYV